MARLFGQINYEAEKKIPVDFGIAPKSSAAAAQPMPKRPCIRRLPESKMLRFRVQADYPHLLEEKDPVYKQPLLFTIFFP